VSPADKAALVRRFGSEVGFDRVGIAPAGPVERAAYVRRWLESGRAGRMEYLGRHLEARLDARALLDGACSVIVAALNYHQPLPVEADAPGRVPLLREPSDDVEACPDAERPTPLPDHPPRGRVAMYAWGDDYHQVVRERLMRMVERLRQTLDEPFEVRVCVDTSPILEREWAAASGVGWIGKNTLVLHPDLGSYFFLGEIVTTLELASDRPITDHCGTCTRCLDACPTGAFPAPYQMDASRCISYLTIELREEIPSQFHEGMGDWLFGCDVCQEVCPHNREAPVSTAFGVRPPGPRPRLQDIRNWSPAEYAAQLRGSAMKRARLDMLQRNAAIVLQNLGRSDESIPDRTLSR